MPGLPKSRQTNVWNGHVPSVIRAAQDGVHVCIAERLHLGQSGVRHFGDELLQQDKAGHIQHVPSYGAGELRHNRNREMLRQLRTVTGS